MLAPYFIRSQIFLKQQERFCVVALGDGNLSQRQDNTGLTQFSYDTINRLTDKRKGGSWEFSGSF